MKETLKKLTESGLAMRKAQKDYFKSYNKMPHLLREELKEVAIMAERDFDRNIKEAQEKLKEQLTMF